MPSVLIIYNPVAGRGRSQTHWPQVEQALRETGIEFDTVTTQASHEATGIAERAAQEYYTVVAVGGDGTVHEVVNGLLRASREYRTEVLKVLIRQGLVRAVAQALELTL